MDGWVSITSRQATQFWLETPSVCSHFRLASRITAPRSRLPEANRLPSLSSRCVSCRGMNSNTAISYGGGLQQILARLFAGDEGKRIMAALSHLLTAAFGIPTRSINVRFWG